MRKLLWKEWHEQSWKLGFGCLVLGAMAVIGLRARIIADIEVTIWVCFIGLALLPILSSTGLLPAERAEGSLETLIALPIKPWKILLAKTVMGILLCIGPMLVAMLASLWVAGNREMGGFTLPELYLFTTLSILSLFFWMLALTARLPSEARGAMIATAVLIAWMIASLAMQSNWSMVFSPFAFVVAQYDVLRREQPAMAIVGAIVVQLVIAIVLWFWTVSQFKVVEDQP